MNINDSIIEVKFGDIFSKQSDLKVISFNEYFDTLVDDKIIAANSLNGEYIHKLYENNVNELNDIISSDAHLLESITGENRLRSEGKQIRYKLGTICNVGDYLLTALSRFDADNRANLEINEYINCLFLE